MRVNNLQELEKVLKQKIQQALETEVKDVVRDVIVSHIFTDVYDAYSPSKYPRRLTNRGLLDPRNLHFEFDGNGGMTVENIAKGSKYFVVQNSSMISFNYNKYLTPIIESGDGYDCWNESFPRPFMSNSCRDLEENHYHTKALKLGLTKQGIEVK